MTFIFKEIKIGYSLCDITYSCDGIEFCEIISKKELAKLSNWQFVEILGSTYLADPLDTMEETITLQSFDSYYSNLHSIFWTSICEKIHARIYGSGRLTGGGSNLHPLFSNILNQF